MRKKAIARLLAPLAAISVLGAVSPAVPANDYNIDPAHSFIEFRIKHLSYSWLHGRFNTISGAFTHDAANPAANEITVVIDPASVDTNHAERDKDLRSANFLDVENYSGARFVSTGYAGNASSGILSGNLTMHGVTQPIEIKVQKIGEGPDPWGGYRAGFPGTTNLVWADFGISYDLGPTSVVMEMELTIEGIKK